MIGPHLSSWMHPNVARNLARLGQLDHEHRWHNRLILDVVSPPRDGPIIGFGGEHRHARDPDQNPCSKASIPKESLDHEYDSFSQRRSSPPGYDWPPSTPPTSARKSAVLGREGGLSLAYLQQGTASGVLTPADVPHLLYLTPKT